MTDIGSEIDRCARCGKCRSVCPTFLLTRDETRVARGRIALLEALRGSEEKPSAYAGEILLSCYRCMRCADACPSGVKVGEVIQEARNMLARRRGLGLLTRIIFRHVLGKRRRYDFMMRWARFLEKPLRRSRAQPLRHLPLIYQGKRSIPQLARRPALRELDEIYKGSGRIKVSVFLGCLLNYVYPEVARSIIRILELHGVDVIVPKRQLCCGTPLLAYGDVETAREIARRNIACLEPERVDAIVLGCASCGLTIQNDYPVLLSGMNSLSGKIYDLTEFISGYLGYSNLPLDEKVTYHDPCHLRWGRGVTSPPRELLRHSSRFVEMEKADDCCGLGGSFSISHYDLSCALGEAKVKAIRESGADIVATACPGCMVQIQDQLARHGLAVPVMHIAQIYELSYLKGRPSAGSPLG